MFNYLIDDFTKQGEKIAWMRNLTDDARWVVEQFGMDVDYAIEIMTKVKGQNMPTYLFIYKIQIPQIIEPFSKIIQIWITS